MRSTLLLDSSDYINDIDLSILINISTGKTAYIFQFLKESKSALF